MVNLAEGTDRAALDAARAEGRTEAAEAMARLASRWLFELTRIAEREFPTAPRDVVEKFTGVLEQTLAQKIEEYRIEQSRSLGVYCEAHRTTGRRSDARVS
jgi:hypothetical protein